MILEMSSLELRVLGAGEVWRGTQRLEVGHRKTLALLAFLALEGETARSTLTTLFWSDNTEEAARRNLRRELHRLREAGLRDFLEASNDHLRLVGLTATDVQQFEALIAEGRLEPALLLWRGELLAGLQLENAPEFDAWLETRREALAHTLRKAQLEQAERLETKGDWHAALELNQKILKADRLQERQHREVMRLQYLLGQREAALAQYEDCKSVLLEELGLEPLPATLHLAQQIRAAQNLTPNIAVQIVATQPLSVPLIGRENALAALSSSSTPLTVVLGEAGGGKTFLLNTAAPHSPRVRFKAVSSQTPLYAVAETIRQGLRDLEAQDKLEALDPIWQLEAARLVPELSTQQSSQAQERSLFLEGLARVLECLTVESLIFEDLHWADAASLELIAHLVRRAPRAAQQPQLIATARADELNAEARQVLESLANDGLSTSITLSALSEAQVSQLIRSLGGPISPAFSNQLFRVTSGNPFFILETIRFLFERNDIKAQAGTWVYATDALPIPPSVLRAVLNRVDRLGGVAKRLLETAALTEDGFNLEEIQPATALSEWEGLEGLEQAVNAQILKRLESKFGFTHDLVRQALQASLSPERQRLIHAKLAASLEQAGAAPARIASHFERADKALQAVPWRIKAAHEAERMYANTNALEHYRAAILSANREDLFAVYQEQLRVLTALGLPQERNQALEHMRQLALEFQNSAWQMQTQLHLAQYLNQTRQHRQAILTIDSLLKQHVLTTQNLAWAWLERGISQFRLGELTTGKHDLSNALTHQTLLEPKIRAEIHSCLRVIALYKGDIAAAENHVNQEMAIAVQSGSVAGKLGATTGMARIAMIKGDVLRASKTLGESLELATRIGNISEQIYAQMWLGYNQIRLGQWSEGEFNTKHAITLAVQSNDNLSRVRLLLLQARLHTLCGQLGKALETSQYALEQAGTVSANAETIALRRLAMIELDIGDTQQAQQHFCQALQLARRSRSKAYFSSLETGLLHCAIKHQDHQASRKHLENALSYQDFAEHNEQADLRLTQAKYLLWSGQANQAQALLEPFRNTAFPEDQWRFWTLELQCQTTSSANHSQALQLAQSSPANPSTLELRRVILKTLEKQGNGQLLELRQVTKQMVLEMATSLNDYPDLKNSFLELHADLL